MAGSALVRALRGRRGPVAAAMALGRRGLGGADTSRPPLMRRSLASGNGTGGSGATGHGAGTGAVSLGCNSGGAGGGVAANSGGCGGATELDRLSKDVFEETRRLWDGCHKLCEADRKMFQELARLEMENASNIVNAKKDLVSATYKVLGCAALFLIGGAASMGPYIKSSVVHETANQVEKRLKLRGEEGADKTDAPGDAAAIVKVDTK